MKNLFLAGVLLLPAFCYADPVVDRPETHNKWFLTVVYTSLDNPTQRDSELFELLRTDERLKHLIEQVVFTEWDNSSRFINESVWKSYLGTNRPALLIQTPADIRGVGTVVYFASGPHLKTDSLLADSISSALSKYRQLNGSDDCPVCPLRPSPTPDPSPAPVAPPATPAVPNIPVIVPDMDVEESGKEETPLLLVLGLPLLGAGFGLFQSIKKESSVV